MGHKTVWEYHPSLPPALTQAANALIDYLAHAPFTAPAQCPWCASRHFLSYPKERRYRCKGCQRAFTPVTNTLFAHCRHQEKWAAYARYRLAGQAMYQASMLCGLSHGAGEYREKVIVQILGKRWPALLPWWSGLRQLSPDGRPAPLRTTPFINLDEARAHHDHEYIQCLECGKLYAQLSIHLLRVHEMSTSTYREKWQIMKQIPLAGLGCRRKHRDHIRGQIASGEVDPHVLAALMQEANRLSPKKKPFKTLYERESSRQSMLERQPWHISPAIKVADEATKRKAVERVNNRAPGETIKSVAKELGIWPGTLWSWRKQLANESMVSPHQDSEPQDKNR